VFDETFTWLGTGTKEGMLLFLIIFIFGIFTSMRNFKEQNLFLFFAFFLPIPFSVILIVAVQWLFQPRYILFILPFYLILVAKGVLEITKQLSLLRIKKFVTLPILITIIFFLSLSQIKNIFALEKENWRGAAEYLSKNMAENELLIVYPSWGFWSLNHYKDLSNSKKLPANTKSHGVGVWFVRPYNAGPPKELQAITNAPFTLKKSFSGWNTINVWFSSSKMKRISLPDLPKKEIIRLKDKNDFSFSPDWSWFATSGKFLLLNGNKNLSGHKYSLTLHSNSSLKDFTLLSPPISLFVPTSSDQGGIGGLYFSARVKASDPEISPKINLYFYDQTLKKKSDANLLIEGFMTGDFTHWGWVSHAVRVPQGASFLKIALEIPLINKKGGWVKFDNLKIYGWNPNPENQVL